MPLKNALKVSFERNTSTIFAVPQTERSSCILLSKMLLVGLSEVLFARAIFDETYFRQKSINKTIVNVLLTATDKSTMVIGNWLSGIEDALDRNYLRSVTFVFSDNERAPADAVAREAYKFSLLRLPNGRSLFVIGNQSSEASCATPRTKQQIADDFESAIVRMLSSLRRIAAQLRHPLPSPLRIAVQLDFEIDVPSLYSPPFFQRGTNSISLVGLQETSHGSVNCGFYKFATKSYVPANDENLDENQTTKAKQKRLDKTDANATVNFRGNTSRAIVANDEVCEEDSIDSPCEPMEAPFRMFSEISMGSASGNSNASLPAFKPKKSRR